MAGLWGPALLAALEEAEAAERGRQSPGAAGLGAAQAAPGVLTPPPWPMLGHDPGRSGATTTAIRPPFRRAWYRVFPDEGILSGVQPVAAEGRVYVGTLAGVLHALDRVTGRDLWTYHAAGPILHTACVAGGLVLIGCADGHVYAVRADKGTLAYKVRTGAAVWNSPVAWKGVGYAGSRDGFLYAWDLPTGKRRWKSPTGGPLLSSPAVDTLAGRVYLGCEDMRVYAFDCRTGDRLWQGEKLPGVTFRGYHPVIAPDGSVLITTAPGITLNGFDPVLLDMVKEVFGDFASWRHPKEENDRLREANFELMAKPETYQRQLEVLRRKLTEEPTYQTFFVLDPSTGRRRYVAPIVYAESMNGTGAPALVTHRGKVIVKYQALLRSRYEHYSPFLNVGYLDTATGDIQPIMDQSRTYGWYDSLLLVHDEMCQLTAAGDTLLNTHQDNVNGLELDTLQGSSAPYARNVHEPAKGEPLALWARLLRGQGLPPGKEWLLRGTAVYGGGSVIDVPVSVDGDQFYYLPTHEINCGAAVMAYRSAGSADSEAKPPTERLTPQEWKRVLARPWDWDTLDSPRLSDSLGQLPSPVPGTRHAPLIEKAEAASRAIPDADLEALVWQARLPVALGAGAKPAMARLERGVRELIGTQWRPLLFPAGKHPEEAYRFFAEPTDTLYTLARAYPYLPAALQGALREYVTAQSATGRPLSGLTGAELYDPDEGRIRSAYDAAPSSLLRLADDITRTPLARLYPLWLWAHVTGDWSRVRQNWEGLRGLLDRAPNPMAEDCRNGHVAGLIAYCRLARQVGDTEAVNGGLAAARQAMRERVAYELAHTRGGLIYQVPVQRGIFSRWRHLTPEVGRLCARYAGPINRELVRVYVDYHRPTWWMAWMVELLWRNESPYSLPTMSQEILQARALILNEPAAKLWRYLDLPWCRADTLYLQKQVLCLEAGAPPKWKSVV
jgi:hypothetical protein